MLRKSFAKYFPQSNYLARFQQNYSLKTYWPNTTTTKANTDAVSVTSNTYMYFSSLEQKNREPNKRESF